MAKVEKKRTPKKTAQDLLIEQVQEVFMTDGYKRLNKSKQGHVLKQLNRIEKMFHHTLTKSAPDSEGEE